jgi:hypothetical protein
MPELRPLDASHNDFIDKNLDLNPQADTGFKENHLAAMGLAVDEELSISSIIGNPEFVPRNEELYKLVKSGEFKNPEAFNISDTPSYVEYDWNAMAREAVKQGFVDIQTDVQIMEGLKETMDSRRRYAMDIIDRSTPMGTVGMFTGMVHATALDPVNVAATILGPIAYAKYIGNINTIRKIMAIEGALGVASEAAISPFVNDWKETLGVDYTFEDAMINMAAAGLFSAGVGGLSAKIADLIRVADADGIDVTPIRLMKKELDDAVDENPEFLTMEPEEFFRNVAEVEEQINSLKPPDSTELNLEMDKIAREYDTSEEYIDEFFRATPKEEQTEELFRDYLEAFVEGETIDITAPPAQDLELRVAARTGDGDVIEGKPGQIHANLRDEYVSEEYIDEFYRATPKEEQTPELLEDYIEAFTEGDGLEMGFVDAEGKFYTREEAMAKLKENDPDVATPSSGNKNATSLDSLDVINNQTQGEPILYKGTRPKGKAYSMVVRTRGEDGKLTYYIADKDDDWYDVLRDNPEIEDVGLDRQPPNEDADYGYIGKDGKFVLSKPDKKVKTKAKAKVAKEDELVDEVKDFLSSIDEEDLEIYVSTEEGMVKAKASAVSEALDKRIKDADDELGVPICGK